MENELLWFLRNKIMCQLFLLVAVFIAAKALNLQNRHWQGRNGKSYTNNIFWVCCELSACHMKNNINCHFHHPRSSYFEANKILISTEQSWISSEVTCNMLVSSYINSQANLVSVWCLKSHWPSFQKVSWVLEITCWTTNQNCSSAVYNTNEVIWRWWVFRKRDKCFLETFCFFPNTSLSFHWEKLTEISNNIN